MADNDTYQGQPSPQPTGEPLKPRRVRPRRRSGPALNEEPPGELDFNKDDGRSGRVGDLRTSRDLHEEFPKAREREAGMTGGELPDDAVTADDLTPETLLDEDRSHSPAAKARRAPADTLLRRVDAAEIGGGIGKDEAELAEEDPVGAKGQDRPGPR